MSRLKTAAELRGGYVFLSPIRSCPPSFRRTPTTLGLNTGGKVVTLPRRSSIVRVLLGCVIVGAALCAPSTIASAATKPGTCKVTGDGSLATGTYLNISETAVQGTGDPNGTVALVTSSGDVYQFGTTYLFCGHDGGGGPGSPNPQPGVPNIANTEGPGTKNGVPGYYFAATIHDHGEGSASGKPINPDEFAIQVVDSTQTTVLFQEGGLLVSGNIQIQTNGL